MNASEVLRKALALLGPNGECWQQGGASGNSSCACIAIYKITDDSGLSYAEKLFMKANGIAGNRYGEIYRWNDSPARTFAEVRDAFEKAIWLAEQEEATHV